MSNAELFWTAFEAISTFLACIIAIFLPIIVYRLDHKRKLHILANSQMYFDTNDISENCLCVQVTNLSSMPIEIKTIYLLIDNSTYKQEYFSKNEINTLKYHKYKDNKLPIIIDIGDRIVYNFSLEKIKEFIETEHQLDYINKNLKIVVVDTLNKKYTLNTKHSLTYFIDKLYKSDG